MTRTTDTKSKRHLLAKLAAGLAISAFLVLGTFVPPASAENWAAQDQFEKNHQQGDRHHDRRGGDRGYYSAPPVVYGSPYGGSYYGSPYAPPPVVYGPGININLW